MGEVTKSDACACGEAEEYFEWLDGLRACGAVNMFGARPLLAEQFGLDKALSAAVLAAWQKTFSRDESPASRAAKAFV